MCAQKLPKNFYVQSLDEILKTILETYSFGPSIDLVLRYVCVINSSLFTAEVPHTDKHLNGIL